MSEMLDTINRVDARPDFQTLGAGGTLVTHMLMFVRQFEQRLGRPVMDMTDDELVEHGKVVSDGQATHDKERFLGK